MNYSSLDWEEIERRLDEARALKARLSEAERVMDVASQYIASVDYFKGDPEAAKVMGDLIGFKATRGSEL